MSKNQKFMDGLKNLKNKRINVSSSYEKLQSNIPALVFTSVTTFIIMILAACAVFFANVKGSEKVLVPNVEGKKLEDALLELQVKELYPKISLRYSDLPGDEGCIMEQSPKAGAIVKGYSRVNLVVSRGVIVDSVGDYIGKTYDEVSMNIQTLFAGQTKPLIMLASPEYIPDQSAAGTILEQDPPAGTSISEPVTVQLIVSRGPTYENTKVPYILGQSINDLLQTMSWSKVVFDITTHNAAADEKPGTVTAVEAPDAEFVPNYTRIPVEMAMPHNDGSDTEAGIFKTQLANYPFPTAMHLDAVPAEGNSYTIVSFTHPGGNLTIPYSVARGTTLVLYVGDKIQAKKVIN